MRQFFKFVFATITGIFISIFVIFFFCLFMVIGVIATATKEKPVSIKPNSVLHLNFNEPILERTPNNPFRKFSYLAQAAGKFDMFMEKGIGFKDIIEDIAKAKNDPSVKGIFIDAQHIPSGIATVEEIRTALLDFKQSKKFIIAYSEDYSQGCYYLASVADKIYLNPQGSMDWRGLSAQVMFFKGMLEKLDVNVQIFKHGKFKSAVEPFDHDKMSEPSRLQTRTYIASIWNHLLVGIAEARHISIDDLNQMASNLSVASAEDALATKMVDGLKYRDQVITELKEKAGIAPNKDLTYIDLGDYAQNKKHKENTSTEKIAVVYAAGNIISGEGDDQTIGSERLSKAIRDARLDKNVKAIVLRVNSPGGSALASDIIWRETLLAKQAKPLIVSMGDVAASGGYYIACAADKIFAEPNTITGSIGVFGLIPDFKKMLNNKLGITTDTVNTNKHSDILSGMRPLDKFESQKVQESIEHIYDGFTKKVAEGRHKTQAEVDSIAQGRVWSGADAKRLGLVDELGGINDAIAAAAKAAKIDGYTIEAYPLQEDFIKEFIKDLSKGAEEKAFQSQFGITYQYLKYLKSVGEMQGVQARIPYDISVY